MIKRVLTLSVALLSALPIFAQTGFLAVPADGASLGLAGADGAYKANSLSVTDNFSATAFSEESVDLGLNMIGWQPSYLDAKIIQVGGYAKANDKLSYGAAYRFETIGTQDITDSAGAINGSFTPFGMALDLGAAYRLDENLAVGASLRYVMSSIYTTMNHFVGVNLNATYVIDSSAIALSLNNLGAANEVICAPMSVELSAAHTLDIASHSTLGVMASASKILAPASIASWGVAAGVEYAYESKYFVRAGYNYADAIYMNSYASIGAAVALGDITIDATYLIGGANTPINSTYMIGISWSRK